MEKIKEKTCSELIAEKEIKKHALWSLPTDAECEEWYDLNIDESIATVSSSIYKFRLWLKERLQS